MMHGTLSREARRRMFSRIGLLGSMLCLLFVAAACGGGEEEQRTPVEGQGTGVTEGSEEEPVITVAAGFGLHENSLFRLNDYAGKYGFRVETIRIDSFADKARAVQRGDVDAAPMGFGDIAQYAAAEVPDVRAIMGYWWGQQWLVVSKDSGIDEWSDLEGKTIGSPPGSYAHIAWLNALNEHGLSEEVKVVNITFDATTVFSAFQRGAYDGVVFFSPFVDQWVLEGTAEFPSTNFLQDSSLGSATGVLVIGPRLVEDRELAVNFVKAVLDLQRDMESNPSKWAEIVTTITGVESEIARAAIERACLGFPLEVDKLKKFGTIAVDYGVVKTDVSDTIENWADLSYLEEATELPVTELTSPPACAPAGSG